MELTSKLVTLFFPPHCLGCRNEVTPFQTQRDTPGFLAGQTDPQTIVSRRPDRASLLTAFDSHWCPDCWRQLGPTAPFQCFKCGANSTTKIPFVDACRLCHALDLRFERAISTGNYRGLLQELIIRMKNQHDEQVAVQLGKLLAFELLNAEFVDELNLVIPVPTHWWRRFRRGFQAAEIVAESVAIGCDIPYGGPVLRCLRRTKKQGTLSTPGRIKNVRGAFDLRPRLAVTDLNILLVDDVMTSGATASEIARVLINQGAAKVYVGVIARGARVS